MKRKILLSLISAVLTIAITTTAAVALLNVSKQTSPITIQTSGVDMSIGSPILENYTSMTPGQTFTVSVRVANINKHPVNLSGVSLQNVTWYDGNRLMEERPETLTITSTNILDQQGSTLVTFAPNSYGYLKVNIQLPATEEYANKTVKFNLKMDFSQQ